MIARFVNSIFVRFGLAGLLTALLVLVAQTTANSWQIQKAVSGGCSAVATDTWNTAYSFPGYVFYTNSNKTWTVDTAGINQRAVVNGSLCHTTGTYYFELQHTGVGGNEDISWGVASIDHPNTQSLGGPGHSGIPDSVAYDSYSGAKQWQYNNGTGPVVGLQTVTNGKWFGIVINLTSGWACIANVTDAPSVFYGNTNTCNPATGSNAFTFTPFAFPVRIAMASNQNGDQPAFTMNAAAPFVIGTIPAGSSPWQP